MTRVDGVEPSALRKGAYEECSVEQTPVSNVLPDLLTHLPLRLRVVLGHSRMPLKDVLNLRVGSVIELDRSHGAPIDVWIDDVLVAQGQVVHHEGKVGVSVISRSGEPSDQAALC